MQIEIIQYIQLYKTSLLDNIFKLITITGEAPSLLIIVAFIFFFINKEKGYKLIFALSSSTVCNSFIKNIVKAPRPIGTKGIISERTSTATSYSFPSGHTQSTTVLWTSNMILFKKKYIYIIGSIFIFLVGLSRLYLGVHWPVDVIFGIIIGIVWSICSIKLFDYINKNKKYKLLLVLCAVFTVITFIIGDNDFFKTCGLFDGVCLAYIIEDKYINYSLDIPLYRKTIIFISTIIGLIIIKYLFKLIFPSKLIFNFIRYFLLGFWALCGNLLIFKKIWK